MFETLKNRHQLHKNSATRDGYFMDLRSEYQEVTLKKKAADEAAQFHLNKTQEFAAMINDPNLKDTEKDVVKGEEEREENPLIRGGRHKPRQRSTS